MATKAKKSKALGDLRTYRGSMNQTTFWSRFGVTQSGGSRYEGERNVPTPVALLLVLHEQGAVNDEQLAEAKRVVEASA